MLIRAIVLQSIAEISAISCKKERENKALKIVTTYMELIIKLTDIYLLSCNNININDEHILEKDVLIIEPVVGQEIEIPFEHIIECNVIDL